MGTEINLRGLFWDKREHNMFSYLIQNKPWVDMHFRVWHGFTSGFGVVELGIWKDWEGWKVWRSWKDWERLGKTGG